MAKTKKSEDQLKGKETPKVWWQWFLVYPTLVISVFGAIPTAVEALNSHSFGVPFGTSRVAKEQNAAWERNLTCTTAPLDPLVTNKKVEVDATICKTGDVLVRVRPPTGQAIYRWVHLDSLLDQYISAERISLFSSAVAAQRDDYDEPSWMEDEKEHESGKIECQRRHPYEDEIVIRVYRPNIDSNFCRAEHVNTYTGKVVSKSKGDCTSLCRLD